MTSLSGRLAVLLAVSAMSAVWAQAPARCVALDVVAEDAHGSAVGDLQKDEIRLKDDNRPQSIVYCRRNGREAESPRVTVVVVNLAYAGVKGPAWNQAVAAMRRFERSEYLYFYVETGRGALLPVHALPERDAAETPGNQPWVDGSLPKLEGTLGSEPLMTGRTHMRSFNAYVELVGHLAAFPGRKNLVCIGCLFATAGDWGFRGFGKADTANLSAAYAAQAAQLRQLSDSLADARVAVYPVGGWAASGRIGDGNGQTKAIPQGTLFADVINALADVSGGRAYAAGEVADAIARAVRDGGASYRIAYLPPAADWDGKPHKIAIASTRRGVRMLAAGWYIADRDEGRPPIPDIAFTSPLEQTDIGVSVSAGKKAANATRIEARVDAHDVLLAPRNGRYIGSLAIHAVCYTADGRRRACTEPRIVKLDLSRQEYDTAMRGGLRFPLDVSPGEAALRIRVAVYDENLRESGTATFSPNGER
jgi:VWFA-related protein